MSSIMNPGSITTVALISILAVSSAPVGLAYLMKKSKNETGYVLMAILVLIMTVLNVLIFIGIIMQENYSLRLFLSYMLRGAGEEVDILPADLVYGLISSVALVSAVASFSMVFLKETTNFLVKKEEQNRFGSFHRF